MIVIVIPRIVIVEKWMTERIKSRRGSKASTVSEQTSLFKSMKFKNARKKRLWDWTRDADAHQEGKKKYFQHVSGGRIFLVNSLQNTDNIYLPIK